MTIYALLLILLFSAISHFIQNSNGQLQTENFYQPSYETITKIQQFEFIFKNILKEQFFQDFVRNITTASKLSPECEQTINSTLSNATLIEQLIDSAGKPGPGILNGNKFWTGDYDTCKKLDGMLYATLSFSISILPVSWGFCLPEACSSSNDTKIMITPLFNSTTAIKYKVNYEGFSISRPFPVGVGETITAIILSIFAFLAFLSTIYVFINRVVDHFSQFSRETYVSKLRQPCPQIPIHANIASEALNSYSESYGSDINQNTLKVEEDKQNPEMTKLLKSNESKSYKSVFTQYLDKIAEPFSLYANIETIFNTEQPPSAIKCLNGIRVLSMFWVIFCHGFLFLLPVAQNPLAILGSLASRYSAQPIINGYFAVDTFFVLSGFLVMYLSLRELSRIKKGLSSVLIFLLKFYIHRILRITPTLFIFMLFFWKIAKYLGDGPFWDGIIDTTNLCDTTWWQVILYINNIFSNNLNSCIAWTWYLANDMQFFIISPLFILPAHFIPFPIPFVPIIIAILISLIPTFSLLSVYNIHANNFFPYNHLNDGLIPSLVNSTIDDTFDIYYTKPYIRISPYLVGLALGYLIYKISVWKTLTGNKRALNIRLTLTSLASWPISIICCYGLVHGLYSSYHGHIFSHFENIIYLGVCRTLWGVGLALFIYICYNGYGGPINAFLSMGFWVPLSRLTFSAYLVHPLILLLFYSTLRQSFYYSDMAFAFVTVGFVVMSYGAAAIMAVFIEFPLAKLEELALKRKKKK